MRDTFECPVCGDANWQEAQRFSYARSDHEDGVLSDYVRRRRRVLFEVWLPGREVVTLQSVYCRDCGFMMYAPRPTEADLDAKYRFLQSLRKPGSSGSTAGVSRDTLDVNRERAKRIHGTVRRYVSAGGLRVLDFGGGVGQLLTPFLEEGHRCAVIDYAPECLPGVEKIGETLADLPGSRRFDVIICSHVLEHLAEPGRTVRELSEHLATGGVIYGEVPLEIWRRIPIKNDPATHINFFTLSSFGELFCRQGLGLLRGQRLRGSYYGRKKEVAVVVAHRGAGARWHAVANGPRETERLLNPSAWARLRRRWLNRQRGRISTGSQLVPASGSEG